MACNQVKTTQNNFVKFEMLPFFTTDLCHRDKHNFAFVSLNRCREGPLWPRRELALEKGAVEMLGSVRNYSESHVGITGAETHLLPAGDRSCASPGN